ncbi:MAG: cytochrome c3 family protein [Alphaproteobacteria bacterium]|nr:cytochrome c3 family protein [Alphaproteobacteria bacterium]
MSKTTQLWLLWFLLTLIGGSVLVVGMFYGGPSREKLLIGKTTSGHHQIELACGACHTSAFNSKDDIEKTCHGCHDAELKAAKDSHPLKKFRDPRNADRLEKLAANKCITCHTEHRPEITNAMGVTLPQNYCSLCHQDVGKNRPSHIGLGFETCASAGCHNYHDNTSLYEDFLEKHAAEPDVKAKPIVKLNSKKIETEAKGKPLSLASDSDAPANKPTDTKIVSEWLATSHAKGGVNCSGCHAPESKSAEDIAANWTDKPSHKVCSTCHEMETATWLQGKHGMRLAKDMLSQTEGLFGLFRDKPLTPMRPELARLPMQSKAAHSELTCTSCHSSHAFDTKQAAVASCSGCHADEHTKAYEGSPHHKLLVAELSGRGEKGTGVSCATCHMPRAWMEDEGGYEEFLVANHNQNANLRPNEKMIRSVCMNCHGLGFSINALADRELIKRNFDGRPSVHIESIDWTMKRVNEKGAK